MAQAIATQRLQLEELPRTLSPTAETRCNDEFRRLVIRAKVLDGAIGSGYVEFGRTKVICSVNGPKEQTSGDFRNEEGVMNVTIHGADAGLRYSIESALKAAVCMKKLARSEVDVEVNVLADDGGILAACLLAVGLAVSSGNIEMFDVVSACSLMILKDDTLVLDPAESQVQSARENGTFGATLTVAIMPSFGQLICTEASGAAKKKILDKAIDYAFQKCMLLYPLISKALRATVDVLPL